MHVAATLVEALSRTTAFAEQNQTLLDYREKLEKLANYGTGPGETYAREDGCDVRCDLTEECGPHAYRFLLWCKTRHTDWQLWLQGRFYFNEGEPPAWVIAFD